jgi:hypothetical protein
MQEKQATIWDVLQVSYHYSCLVHCSLAFHQVPTIDRITIMSKYSTGEYAPGPPAHSLPPPPLPSPPHSSSRGLWSWTVYHDSINHWCLVAIIVAIRIGLRNLYLKCQRGLLEIPQDQEVINDWFFRQVLEVVPLQLRRNYHVTSGNSAYSSNSRIRKKVDNGSGGNPDEQVRFLLDDLRNCLTFENEEIEFEEASRMELQQFLLQSVKYIDSKLIKELDEVRTVQKKRKTSLLDTLQLFNG